MTPGAFGAPRQHHGPDAEAGVTRLSVRVDCGRQDPFCDADVAFTQAPPEARAFAFGPVARRLSAAPPRAAG